ncbi:MAG: AMP-binding protein [Microcoleaceae cyanobacterium]
MTKITRFLTLIELLCYRAENQPNKIAYTFLGDGETETDSLSYKELERIVKAIATELKSLNLTGKTVLLMYPPGLEFITAFLGCLYAGVIAVPVHKPSRNQSLSRLQAIISDSQAKVILTKQSLLELTDIESRLRENPDLGYLQIIATDNLNSNHIPDWQQLEINQDHLAFLQYTSGSTGTPKGVMVSHNNLIKNLVDLDWGWGHPEDSVMVTWLPTFHDMGLIYGVLQPLYKGFPCYLMPSLSFIQKPIRWLKAISKYKGTHSGAPSFAYDLCVQKITPEQKATLDLSSWRIAFNGAEPVRADVLQKFAESFTFCGFNAVAFCPGYGLAEATLKVTAIQSEKEPIYVKVQADFLEKNQVVDAKDNQENTKTFVGCGWTAIDTKIVIVNPESLTPCSPDEIGEIWVSGSTVAQGYWKKPEATISTFQNYLEDNQEKPFLRTGDLGFIKNEQLFVTGRIKDLIIIRGCNYYPQDIELTVEKSHVALRANANAAFTVNVESEESLVIIQEVEFSYLRKLDVDEVVKAIRKAVSNEYELQVYAVVLLKTATIFKTTSGKIQRQACRREFLLGNLQIAGQWQQSIENITPTPLLTQELSNQNQDTSQNPRSKEAITNWLINKISNLLKVSPNEIKIDRSFDNYGIDSLALVSLSGDLEQWLGCRLSKTLAYDYPTIKALSEYLAQKTNTKLELPSTLVALQSQGQKPPFFCVHPLAGLVFPYYKLAELLGSDQPFYAFQSVGIDNNEKPLKRIEDMAAHYIKALLVVQPEAPYYLGGWSFGAYVAFEMARQLQQMGKKVNKVILLDTPPPSNQKIINFFELWKFFLSSSLLYIWPYVYDYLYLKNTTDNGQKQMELWNWIEWMNFKSIAHEIEKKSRLMEYRQPTLNRIIKVILANSEAIINYTSQIYTGKITLFRTNEQFGINHQDMAWGWSNLAKGGLEIHKISGHHLNILRQPYVEIVAQKLKICLEQAN